MKKCPFCGGDGRLKREGIYIRVECKECLAKGSGFNTEICADGYNPREEAIKIWNRRI